MDLKKGWLDRQLNSVATEVKRWPEWMQKEAKLPSVVESSRSPAPKAEIPMPSKATKRSG